MVRATAPVTGLIKTNNATECRETSARISSLISCNQVVGLCCSNKGVACLTITQPAYSGLVRSRHRKAVSPSKILLNDKGLPWIRVAVAMPWADDRTLYI